MRLILASTSPRRREILTLLGVSFAVVEPAFEEQISREVSIEEEVLAFAREKARSVALHYRDDLVMLRALAGKTHRIFTAVAIIDGRGGEGLETLEQVQVDMLRLSDAEIDHYLACDESLDKAGGYSIQGQGAKLIAAIRGDYLAAVGLPLRPIADYLTRQGVPLRVEMDRLYREKSFLNWQRF
jgi:septum formation protein